MVVLWFTSSDGNTESGTLNQEHCLGNQIALEIYFAVTINHTVE